MSEEKIEDAVVMTVVLTHEQIEAKAQEISESLKDPKTGVCPDITPLLFEEEDGTQIIGYISEPSFNQVCHIFDKMATGLATDGAAAVFDLCLLKGHSDPRFYSGKKEDKKVRLSGVISCMSFVKVYQNKLKKK